MFLRIGDRVINTDCISSYEIRGDDLFLVVDHIRAPWATLDQIGDEHLHRVLRLTGAEAKAAMPLFGSWADARGNSLVVNRITPEATPVAGS